MVSTLERGQHETACSAIVIISSSAETDPNISFALLGDPGRIGIDETRLHPVDVASRVEVAWASLRADLLAI